MKFSTQQDSGPQTTIRARNAWQGGGLWALWLVWLAALWPGIIGAANWEDARLFWAAGNYSNCAAVAEQMLQSGSRDEDWYWLRAQSLFTLGRYAEARVAITNALEQNPSALRFRMLARDIYLFNGEEEAADKIREETREMIATRSWYYQDPASLVACGRLALSIGADARAVLEKLYDVANKSDPNLREAYQASGELALSKHDYELAARSFAEGLKKFPDDPDLNYGMARAQETSDALQMKASLAAVLKQNTNHIPSLLLMADHLITAEDFEAAGELLDHVCAINPWQPEAWAYRAVLAHLRNDHKAEKEARETALKFYKTNPAVDHLIGLKLSQKYRFKEGALYQRRALQLEAKHLPAQAQLAQDLLRLGEEEEGWQLANQVHERDGYDVAMFNLVTLHDALRKFQTLTNRDFIVRMSPSEAAIYGARVLELLGRAKATLTKKYGLDLTEPTTVEIFPNQKDFGVRTFGMPENPGFLGVCFGSVVTANSPASHPGHAVNWEAVLWHEFCHVITLHLTRNRMPRWLSEGISVYEELQANPHWGQAMTPRYRQMILEGELTPVGKLSAAFLAPPTEMHLQFAYFESALVVEFLVDRFGQEKLKAILQDLGEGAEINATIAKHTAPLEKIEKAFAAFAKERALQMAPALDWAKPTEKEKLDEKALAAWSASRPTNYWALKYQAQQWLEEKQFQPAKAPLETLIKRFPGYAGADNAYAGLALAHRSLGETNEERQVLAQWAARSADALEAYGRLMELCALNGDWPAVRENARRYLAVNPLAGLPYRWLGQAAEKLGDRPTAINAYQTLLRLDPPNPAETHFQLAKWLHEGGDPGARREVLLALEEAPRYRAALELLLAVSWAKTNQPAINK